MFIPLALVVTLALVSGLEFPGAKKHASMWKLDETLTISSESSLTMRIALNPRNAAELTDKVHSIADPKSANFRKYLDNKQITELVGVSQADMDRVLAWARESNFEVVEVPQNRDWVTVRATAGAIEKGLKTKLASWTSDINGQRKIGAVESYTIPDHVADVIQFIPGMTSFSFGSWRPVVQSADAAAVKEPNGVPAAVTPATIWKTYQTPTEGSHGSKLGSQAVIEYGKSANFNTADLQSFFKQLNPAQLGETCGVAYGDNNGDVRASVEANLDVQYIMATGQFVNTTTYKIAEPGVGIEDQMLDYTYIVGNQTQPALVHSISYGEYGGDYDNATDQRFNYELQKMAARGITVLLASGDNGVGCDKAGTTQEYDYPSSPYITMVGATYVDSSSGDEVGATLSSGGFSKDFYRPSWQDSAVNGYFASPTYKAHTPSETFYRDGRAYPDVAAFGQNVQVVTGGKASGVSGTSCSAPIFAGIVANLNH
eukprot:gene19763-22469_t